MKTENGKRARMGRTEKNSENCSSTPPSRKRKPSTRARTLKDMINTINSDKTRCKKKEHSDSDKDESSVKSPLGKKSRLEVEESTCTATCDESTVETKANDGPFVTASLPSVKCSKTGPSARWGHSLCMISDEEAILIGGQGDKQQICRDSVWHLDLVRGEWKSADTCSTTTGPKPEHRMGHTAVYDPTVRCIYLFGGSKNLKWFNDVHILDLDECKWQVVQANGKAPTRAYHSATLYRHELWIFGGVFPQPMSQPDGCSNEVHVFSPLEKGWYSPIVMGEKPLAKSGHSATLLQDQLVVFGGWDAPISYNHLEILDLVILEWTRPKTNGKPPCPRSWHASSALSGNRLMIHGGYNGDEALDDSYIFNLDTSTWTSVIFDVPIVARTGHTGICLPYKHENNNTDEVLIFGGGDNEGSFFQDLIEVMVPFEDKSTIDVAS